MRNWKKLKGVAAVVAAKALYQSPFLYVVAPAVEDVVAGVVVDVDAHHQYVAPYRYRCRYVQAHVEAVEDADVGAAVLHRLKFRHLLVCRVVVVVVVKGRRDRSTYWTLS
uniref:Secreted protein n=1 Tax=Acrobeloides nanus TaxID=290746 RepID=A0A914DPJ5_9BILA